MHFYVFIILKKNTNNADIYIYIYEMRKQSYMKLQKSKKGVAEENKTKDKQKQEENKYKHNKQEELSYEGEKTDDSEKDEIENNIYAKENIKTKKKSKKNNFCTCKNKIKKMGVFNFSVLNVSFFCMLLSTTIFSHIILLGCYEYYEENEYMSNAMNENYDSKSIFDAKNPFFNFFFFQNNDSEKSDHRLNCPVLPKPLRSLIFHSEWFYRIADIPHVGKSYFSLIKNSNFIKKFPFVFAAVSTLAEWLFILYVLTRIVWSWFIRPAVHICYIIMVFYIFFKIAYFIFQLYGKNLSSERHGLVDGIFTQIDYLLKQVQEVVGGYIKNQLDDFCFF